MNCKNCGLRVEGNFCSHCGQKASIGRITVANFLHEVSESIFQINRGFFYTLGELFVRPGKSIDEFLQGKRKRHFKPIAYLIALSTAYFLTTQITGQNTWVGDIITGWMNHATEQDANADLPEVATWFLTNYAYATLLLLPVFSLASYLSFFPFGKTYLEHIVINSYITGQQAIFYTLFIVVSTVIDSYIVGALPLFIAIAYTFWVYWQLFPQGNRAVNILRSILTYILYLVFSVVLLGIFMAFSG